MKGENKKGRSKKGRGKASTLLMKKGEGEGDGSKKVEARPLH